MTLRITKILLINLLFWVITIYPAFSVETLTLENAITRALSNNHKIKANTMAVKESEENVGIARSSIYPRITFTESFQRTDNPPQSFFFKLNERQLDMANTNFNYPGINTDFESKFLLTQPLFTGGKLSANVKIAKDEVEISKRQKEKTEEEIAYQVCQAYYNLLIVKRYQEISESAVKDATEHYRIAQVNFEEGRGIKSDMLSARVYLTQMEENKIKVNTQLEIAKRAFSLVLGENPNHPIDAEGQLTYTIESVNVEDSIQQGIDNRKEIQELLLRKNQITYQKTINRSEFLPGVNLMGSFQWNSDNTPFGTDANSWFGAIVISYPIFQGGERIHKMRLTDASAKKLNETIEDTKKNISFEIAQSVLQLDEDQKRMELTRHSVEQADEALRLLEIRYENGLTTLSELNDAQTALNQAKAGSVQSIAEYLMTLKAIQFRTGIILKSLSGQNKR